jgi:hypothetical protein
VIESPIFFALVVSILDPLILSFFAQMLLSLKQTAGITAYTFHNILILYSQMKKNHPLVADDFFDSNK